MKSLIFIGHKSFHHEEDKPDTIRYFSLTRFNLLNKQNLVNCEELNDEVLSFNPKNQMVLYNLAAIAATQGKKIKLKNSGIK